MPVFQPFADSALVLLDNGGLFRYYISTLKPLGERDFAQKRGAGAEEAPAPAGPEDLSVCFHKERQNFS